MSNLSIGSLVELPPWEIDPDSVFGLGDVCVGVVCGVKKISLAGEAYEVFVGGQIKTFHRDELKVWKNGKKKEK